MEKFSWTKAFGLGALIWLIMFALVSFFVGIKVYDNLFSKIVIVIFAGVLAYIVASSIKSLPIPQVFNYALVWVLVGISLDFLISKQFNTGIFSTWEYWAGSVLILIAPVIRASLTETSIDSSKNISPAH